MEYWIIYDIASGTELYRGSGTAGTAGIQQLPEGAGLVVVPQSVVAGAQLNLDALRAALAARIDAEAELVRQRFLTPGAGQAMTYQRKEAEARAWLADNTAATPFLSAEASARDVTVSTVASEVLATADAWVAIGSVIEGKRMAAKGVLAAAFNLTELLSAATVDWTFELA